MNSPLFSLLVLAGIAVFLILRLRNVLGTREGFEPPREAAAAPQRGGPALEVIEGGPDQDILDHAEEGGESAISLAKMKSLEPDFGVNDFLQGARGAYEMILMAFERGDMASILPFLSKDVYESFAQVVDGREAQGLSVEAEFVGVRELALKSASFDEETREGEISVKFIGELTSVVRDRAGDIVEGNEDQVKRQKDIWTFSRVMGSDDPNWQLVATGE
ncbi:Tim44-like domain protein [Shimia sp. SK013]|uniref:Tim44/TimA family putative adaptor protein n=1 Tax=Shimia sp. SK013 TaxID=1389006 RepID=UPI0006B5AA3F|nr:Tim44/TimA family putative adaptor protein [Shimia sp. SK013]KPA19846.1 Tim44-like domain protein [Shimia sp. SK013]